MLLLLLLLRLLLVVVLLHLPGVVLAAVVQSVLPGRRLERVRVEENRDSVLVLLVEVGIVARADAMLLTVARVEARHDSRAGGSSERVAFAS